MPGIWVAVLRIDYPVNLALLQRESLVGSEIRRQLNVAQVAEPIRVVPREPCLEIAACDLCAGARPYCRPVQWSLLLVLGRYLGDKIGFEH